jgi:hypothetical protein
LTQPEATQLENGRPQRFDVVLFIVHPALDPADISAALGLGRTSHIA